VLSYALILSLLMVWCLGGCAKEPPLPYDPAVAATQAISDDPTQPPNDAEWKLIHDAVMAGPADNADWQSMRKLVAKRQCPVLPGYPEKTWFGRTQFLLTKVLSADYKRTMLTLQANPADEEALKHKADLLTVHRKWVGIYNAAVEPVRDQLDPWGFPLMLHPLED